MGVSHDRPEWFEIRTHTHPEDGQAIQAEANAHVVDDAHVEIPGICAEIAFVEFSQQFEHNGHKRKYWLHLDIFYRNHLSNRCCYITEYSSRITPRFRNKNVCGSLTSTSFQKMLAGNAGYFGERPWRRMRRERSPPR